MSYLAIILIAVSLSIDAFSVSLAYGLMNFSNKKIFLTSALIGVFHFFMPILGLLLGKELLAIINIEPKYIISIIFIILILEMIKSLKTESKETKLTVTDAVLLAFAVSIDSFSVGIGLAFITNKIIFSCLMFTITSFLFTFCGFKLGKFITNKIGVLSKIIGIIMLIFLTIFFLLDN